MDSKLDCDFEEGNLCNWVNDKTRGVEKWTLNDQNDWGITYGQQYFKSIDYRLKIGPQDGDATGNKSSFQNIHILNQIQNEIFLS